MKFVLFFKDQNKLFLIFPLRSKKNSYELNRLI